MPTSEQFSKAKGLVKEQALKIANEAEWETRDDDTEVLEIRADKTTLFVEASPEEEYFIISYIIYFARNIGRSLTEEEQKSLLDDSDYANYSGDLANDAGLELLSQQSPELLDEFQYQLEEKLTSPQTGHTVWTSDSGIPYGFAVSRHLFPYQEEYNLQDFDEGAQAVTSIGRLGYRFVESVFDLVNAESDDGDTVFSLDM